MKRVFLIGMCMVIALSAFLGGCGEENLPVDATSRESNTPGEVETDPKAEKYNAAIALMENGDFENALIEFETLGDYKDAQSKAAEIKEKGLPYAEAKKLMEEGKYPDAAWTFAELDSYRDSADLQKRCETMWRQDVAVTSCDVSIGYEWTDDDMPTDLNYAWCVEDGIAKAKANSYYKIKSDVNLDEKKIVSVGAYNSFLYDDGTAYGMEDYKHNGRIIKLSGGVCGAYVTLQSDGSMDVYYSEEWFEDSDIGISKNWFKKIYSWENIVDFMLEFDYLEATFANFDLKITAYFADGTKATLKAGNME